MLSVPAILVFAAAAHAGVASRSTSFCYTPIAGFDEDTVCRDASYYRTEDQGRVAVTGSSSSELQSKCRTCCNQDTRCKAVIEELHHGADSNFASGVCFFYDHTPQPRKCDEDCGRSLQAEARQTVCTTTTSKKTATTTTTTTTTKKSTTTTVKPTTTTVKVPPSATTTTTKASLSTTTTTKPTTTTTTVKVSPSLTTTKIPSSIVPPTTTTQTTTTTTTTTMSAPPSCTSGSFVTSNGQVFFRGCNQICTAPNTTVVNTLQLPTLEECANRCSDVVPTCVTVEFYRVAQNGVAAGTCILMSRGNVNDYTCQNTDGIDGAGWANYEGI